MVRRTPVGRDREREKRLGFVELSGGSGRLRRDLESGVLVPRRSRGVQSVDGGSRLLVGGEAGDGSQLLIVEGSVPEGEETAEGALVAFRGGQFWRQGAQQQMQRLVLVEDLASVGSVDWEDVVEVELPGEVTTEDQFVVAASLRVSGDPVTTSTLIENPTGTWRIFERDGSGDEATQRLLMSGRWVSQVRGDDPLEPGDLDIVSVAISDGDSSPPLQEQGPTSVSGSSRERFFKFGGVQRFVLQMRLDIGPPNRGHLLDALISLRVTVRFNVVDDDG
ncbi:MAG: hypothetical protein ACK4E3_03565 [Brevundimonas sp.]|uniref:hypothetical protein n=1 Tax=Brevundimonas sp. TaxID=1871086 RepID=UPI00391C78CD